MRRGDIYLVTLDPTEEHEQQGTRPVLVISPDEFNRVTQVPVVLPITSGGILPVLQDSPCRSADAARVLQE